MLKKALIFIILYSIFSFAFLRLAWGKGTEAGESAQIESTNQTEEEPTVNFDLRPIKLHKFLRSNDSKLADYTAVLIKKADKYHVDWALFPAIAGVESGFCKAYIVENNNCVGWGGGYIKFASIEQQIDTVLKTLKKNYIDEGLTTVDLIGHRYAADPSWSTKVKKYIFTMKTVSILN